MSKGWLVRGVCTGCTGPAVTIWTTALIFFFFSVFTQALYVAWLWRLHVGRYMRISIGYIMESNNDLASPQNSGSVDLVSYTEAHIDQLQS